MEPSTDTAGSQEWRTAADRIRLVPGYVEFSPVSTDQLQVIDQGETEEESEPAKPEPPFGTHIREAIRVLKGS